jgi:hypothetical protein
METTTSTQEKTQSLIQALSFEEGIVQVAEFLLNKRVDPNFIEPDNSIFTMHYCDKYGVDKSVIDEALSIAIDRIDNDENNENA